MVALQFYVKASNERPWGDRAGTFSAPGLTLMTLGEVVIGPVSVKACKDGAGRWRRLHGVCELFGAAQRCEAHAYRVLCEDGAERIYILGGQLGLLFAGNPTPMLWVECPGGDLAPRARQALLSDVALCQRCGRILADSDSPYWNDGGEVFLCAKCARP